MRLRQRTAIEHAVCLALLSAVPLVLLLPGMIRDEVPVNARSTLAFPPWEEARPNGTAIEETPTENTEAQRYYPWYTFLGRVEHVKDVLWNPLEFAGQPFFAIWRTRCLSLFTVPFYFADTPTALRVSLFLKLWVAGVSAFYVGRRLGLRPALAMIPAGAFQLCGPLLVWSVMPISDVLPWLPLLLLFSERLALGHYRAWPGGALIVALSLLAGEPEACAALLAFALAYFVLRSLMEWRGFGGTGISLATFVGAVALGFGLAGVQWLPFTEFIHYAVASARPEVRYAPGRIDVAAWVFPYVSTDPVELQPAASISAHSGFVLVLLLMVWFSLWPFAETRTRHRCIALLVPIFVLNGLAPFWLKLREIMPFANTINPEHLLMVNGFALGLIGAFTADEWLRLGPDEIKGTAKRFSIIGPLCVAGVIAAVVWHGPNAGLVTGPWWAATIAVLIGIAATCALAYTAVAPSVRFMGYTLTSLIVIDLAITFVPNMPSTPRALLYPETPFVALLKKSGGRVTGSVALADWPLAGNGVKQLYGCAGVVLKHQRDYKERAEQDPLLLRRAGSPLLLLKQEDILGKFAPLREMLRVEQVLPTGAILFYDTEAENRAFMAYEARNVEKYSPDEVKSTSPVLLEQGVPPPPLPPDAKPGTVAVLAPESNTKVRIALDGTSKGILVLADAFFPGWEAVIDGKPGRVVPVDLLYRGVEVPAGTKEVIFQYNPPLVKAGMMVSVISLGILIAGTVLLLPSIIRTLRERRSWGMVLDG